MLGSFRVGAALGVAAVIAFFVAGAIAAGPAAQDDDTRNLWDTGFAQKRPKAKASGQSRKPARYRRATPPLAEQAKTPAANPAATPATPQPIAPLAEDAIVGVTVWRLRPSARVDGTGARILIHEPAKDEDAEWTPERVEADTPIAENQRVRLSIEAPRAGFLYVVDREQYADGTFGKPYLIFPTTRTRGGNNAVSAGSVVEIPAQSDNPIFFTLKRSRPDHVAEVITVLVTPQPLPEVKIGRGALELPETQVAQWEAQWGARAERLELAGGAGTAYTEAEKMAGADPSHQLTQGDPLPQTIYRVVTRPGDPVLITVPLRIGQ
jgi:hypothetical protein